MESAQIVELLNYRCPETRIKKRFISYYKRQTITNPVSKDLVFDDVQWKLLMKYARSDKLDRINQITSQLHDMSDEEGRFCKSHYNYEAMLRKSEKFIELEAPSFTWNEHFKAAMTAVTGRLRQAHLKMLRYGKDQDVVDALQHWDTSAGFTAWVELPEGGTTKEQVLRKVPSIKGWYLEAEEQAKASGTFNMPRTVAHRTQASLVREDGKVVGFKRSTRAVVIDPLELIIAGSKFVRPMIDWLSSSFSGFAVGKDDAWINQWVQDQKLKECKFASLDYSAYDSTIPSWLIHSVFDVMRAMFDDPEFDDSLWKIMEHDFTHKFVLIKRSDESFGEWWHHGTTSGSSFTTVVNCIANMLITETWSRRFNAEILGYNIMGDDNLIAYRERLKQIDWKEVASYISRNFGIQVNEAKSGFTGIGGDPEYLSRTWTAMGCDRDDEDLLAVLLYPEKWRNYKAIPDPMVVMWSYILAYPVAMRRLVDVNDFLRDCNLSYFKEKLWTKEELSQLPYNLRMVLENAKRNARFSLRTMTTLQSTV